MVEVRKQNISLRYKLFTLVEVLIAIVITVGALVTGYQTMGHSRKQVYSTRFYIEAELLAYDTINALAQLGYNGLGSRSRNETITLNSTDQANIYYKPFRTAIQDDIKNNGGIDLTPDLSRHSGKMAITIRKGKRKRYLDMDESTPTDDFDSKWYNILVEITWEDPLTRKPATVKLRRVCYR